MAFSTVSVYSLVSSLIYEFLFISSFFVAFWKKKFTSFETRLSSEIILSCLAYERNFVDYLSLLRK